MRRHVEIVEWGTDRVLSTDADQQKAVDEHQLVTWLLAMGPWDVIAHLTWRDLRTQWKDGSERLLGISEWSAARGVERFMNALPGVSYFYSVERNPGRPGHHAHMLWGDCQNLWRKEQWARWYKLHGRALIEPVRTDEDVAAYASKYVMKLPCWWNVKLRWHRQQKLNGAGFKLSSVGESQLNLTGQGPFSTRSSAFSPCPTEAAR